MKKISTILLLLIAALCTLPFVGSCQSIHFSTAEMKPNMPAIGTATMEMHPWCIGRQTTLEMKPWMSADETPCLTLGSNDTIPATGAITISEGGLYQMTGTLTPKTKTDTISVNILCQASTNSIFLDRTARIESRQMERQLEWRERGNNYTIDDSYFNQYVWTQKSQWIVKSTRYLEPIEGCYQLIPIQND